MKSNLAAILLGAALLAAQPAGAEGNPADLTDMAALRTAVRADKKALVASTLQLTPTEAKRFWPLYDAYQRIADRSNQRRAVAIEGLVALDRPISDLYARNLAADLIGADEDEVKARRTLQNRLMRGVPTRVLPPKKAARYLQLESKIRAMQAYDIAAGIPLVR
jgi:Spy/CpxP family protein refolding chaperone